MFKYVPIYEYDQIKAINSRNEVFSTSALINANLHFLMFTPFLCFYARSMLSKLFRPRLFRATQRYFSGSSILGGDFTPTPCTLFTEEEEMIRDTGFCLLFCSKKCPFDIVPYIMPVCTCSK